VAYVPLLFTHVGKVGADTKQYLYLDPAKLLSRAASMWDPSIGLGTVTHQNIGYLFPMGPYYWAAERLGLPDWIAQRIWMGSIIFLAGLGVRKLMTTLAWQGPGVTVAAFAYALSPYLLHYVYKHSVILLPFTALPWLLLLTIRSLRHPGWRDPALFALVALAAGGVNATSLLLVLLAPGLWIIHAVVVERDVAIHEAVKAMARIGVLSLITSLWWMAGLSVQGQYGINILRATETYTTVSNASSAAEVTRGLGYWFFYGIDPIGPWFKAAVTMTQNLPAMAVSFALPTVAIGAALWTRFRYRIFFSVLAITGMVVSVGAHPRGASSPYGKWFDAFSATESGLAMRSTPRAVPLVALGIAVFLGAGVAAAANWKPSRRLVFAGLAMALILANLSPLWTGRMLDEFLERPEQIPPYWTQVGQRLDRADRNTRALEAPGIEFANYRWGATVDPITPGLTDRDYVARELVPYGSPPSADLTVALDLPMQDGTYQPDAYAALLRLIGAGDLVLRNDLEYERFRTPRPRPFADAFAKAEGFDDPESFGPGAANVAGPRAPLIDDLELALDESLPDPPEVTVHAVDDPLGVVRAAPGDGATVLAGDASGLVGAAEAGVLDPDRLTVYAGTLAKDNEAAGRVLDASTRLVITDTNRKAGRRWGNTKDIWGATEMVDETPPEDSSDFRLPIFPDADTDSQTVAVQDGGLRVTASGYGNPLSFTPGDRAVNAADGDPETAWRVGAFSDVRGEWIQFEATDDQPLSSESFRVIQATGVNRFITQVRVVIDGRRDDAKITTLDEASRTPDGQIIATGPIKSSLRLEVVATDAGVRGSYQGLSGVGFAEVRLGDREVTEFIRPPIDLRSQTLGPGAEIRPLAYVLRRQTASKESGATDPELSMRRIITLAQPRQFIVAGQARLSPRSVDAVLQGALGAAPERRFTSSGHLVGDTAWRAEQAFDGDPSTAWQSNLNADEWWVEVTAESGLNTEISQITVMNDGRHSVPTRLHVEVDGVRGPDLRLEATPAGDQRGQRTTLRFDPQQVSGRQVRLVIDEVAAITSPDWLTDLPVRLPVGIASVGGLDTPLNDAATQLPTACRDDLVTLDGKPVPVRLTGTVGEARRGDPINVNGCMPLDLSRGEHRLIAGDPQDTGWSVDLMSLRADWIERRPGDATALNVERTSRTTYNVSPTRDLQRPTWLVLGQSFNDGWELRVDGRAVGPPMLVNGFANGWKLDPDEVGARPRLTIEWTPQRRVWWALALSGLGALLCLILASRPVRPAIRTARTIRPHRVAWGDAFGHAPPRWTAAAVIAVSGAGTALIVSPWWAPVAVVAAALSLYTDWGWRALRAAAVGLIGLGGAYVVVKQWRNDYPLDFNWPQLFERAQRPMMLGWALLAVECAVEAVRAGWRRDANLDDADQDGAPASELRG